MSISSQTTPQHDTFIIITGRLDQSQINELTQALQESLNSDHPQIIIDLTDTTYINRGGLRCLVTGWRNAKQKNGNLYLCGLNDRLKEIFNMVGFDQVFTIYETKESALQR